MAKKFKTEIVTPERLVFSQEVESLIIPAERGYLGVLAGHAPLLCTLKPGEVTIRGEKGETHYATSGGFMEVTPQKASLLTESAEESKKRAQERLAIAAGKDVDKSRAKAALERAENRLRLAQKFKK